MTVTENVYWVHPSVRDLVIEYLAANPAERRHFLTHAGSRGISLALSLGGGAAGKRTFPLLKDPEDWAILKDRLQAMASGSNPSERSVVLSVVGGARTRGDRKVPPEILDLMSSCLPLISSGWTAAAQPLDPLLLERFFLLSMDLDPLPPSPSLSSTWSYWYAFVESADADSIDLAWVAAAKKWVRIVNVIQANEPRFLKQIGFPGSIREALDRAVSEIRSWVDTRQQLEDLEWDDEDGLIPPEDWEESELAALEALPDLLQDFRELFAAVVPPDPDLDDEILTRATEREDRQATWTDASEQEPDEYERESARPAAWSPSVEDVFSDL